MITTDEKSVNKGMMLSSRNLLPLMALALLIVVVLGGAVDSLVLAQDPAKVGASLKVPNGYMRAPLDDFKGLMMLDPKRAAGMVVTYANDNETTEALTKRLLDYIGPMFIHEKGTAKANIAWTTKPLLPHPGDGQGKATMNTYSDPDREVQVAIYERTGASGSFIYGYFAMHHTQVKPDDGKFLDDQGNGVKDFDKLWKSFEK